MVFVFALVKSLAQIKLKKFLDSLEVMLSPLSHEGELYM